MQRLGLDPDRFLAAGTDRVWVAITAHGWDDDRVGFGDDVAATAGLVAWHPDGRPRFAADAIADPLGGAWAAAAARDAWTAGGRWFLDASLAGIAAAAVTAATTEAAPTRSAGRRAAGGSVGPRSARPDPAGRAPPPARWAPTPPPSSRPCHERHRPPPHPDFGSPGHPSGARVTRNDGDGRDADSGHLGTSAVHA